VASTSVTMTTYACDAAECQCELTLGGENSIVEAEEAGWLIGKPVLHKMIDFCPDCANIVKEMIGA
jgi:hypothetical protein